MIIPVERQKLWYPGKPVSFNFSNAALLGWGCGCCGGPIAWVVGTVPVPEGDTAWKLSTAYSFSYGSLGWDIEIDSSENVYIAGTRLDSKSVWKLNSVFVEQWNFDTGDHGFGIAVDGSGNVYVAGAANADKEACWKLNSAGVEQWNFTKDRNNYNNYGVAVDGSGNVYTCGMPDIVSDDNIVWKLNSAGVEQWGWGAAGHIGYDVAVDGSGNVYVACIQATNNKSIVKLNSAGVEQWSYDTGGDCWGIAVDGSGNVYATGGTVDGKNVWKLNSAGELQWRYNTGGNPGRQVRIGTDGYIYVVGIHNSSDKALWKLDSSGNLIVAGNKKSTYFYGVAIP